MSDHMNYRRAAAAKAAEIAAFENFSHEPELEEILCGAFVRHKRASESRPAGTLKSGWSRRENDACLTISKAEQLVALEEISGYIRKKSNLLVALGCIQPCDRTCHEAAMGYAALKALPYFNPEVGTKRSTYLIEAIEHYLIDEHRKECAQKRTARLVPITTMDIVEAQARGLASEEMLEDRSRGGFRRLYFRMDYLNFMMSLTYHEQVMFESRMQGASFEQLADWYGYSSANTFRRKAWRLIQEKAVKFGGFEGKMVEL
ncbi:MAG: hypothetical protein K6F50_08685 [Kiritimatiellae bacterium]|nr:hypothetical protein [Kiritimatiellia bacterium]